MGRRSAGFSLSSEHSRSTPSSLQSESGIMRLSRSLSDTLGSVFAMGTKPTSLSSYNERKHTVLPARLLRRGFRRRRRRSSDTWLSPFRSDIIRHCNSPSSLKRDAQQAEPRQRERPHVRSNGECLHSKEYFRSVEVAALQTTFINTAWKDNSWLPCRSRCRRSVETCRSL